MGIRTRIQRSFFALGLIFIVAGTAAYMEFIALNRSTQRIADLGNESIKLSTAMLDIVHKHNEIYLELYAHRDTAKLISDSEIYLNQLDSAISVSFNSQEMIKQVGTLKKDIEQYKKKVRNFYNNFYTSENYDWYSKYQSEVYVPFITSMKNYIISSQEFMVAETSKTDANIHRTLMTAVVTLTFMVIILFIFYKMLDIYYIRPVTRLTKSLDEYLVSKIPFVVKVDGKDEVYRLKGLILDLISQNKSLARRERDVFKK